MDKIKASLHDYEKQILLVLKGEMDEQALVEKTKLPPASVSHACLWLYSKGLVEIKEERTTFVELNEEGKKYLEKGLPERQALNVLQHKKKMLLNELEDEIGKEKTKIALTWLMRNKLAKIVSKEIELTEKGEEALYEKTPEEKALETIKDKKPLEEVDIGLIEKRGKIINKTQEVTRTIKMTDKGNKLVKSGISTEKELNLLTPELIKTRKWEQAKFRSYNIQDPVPVKHYGKRHFGKQAVEYCRRAWLEMGFKEMRGPLINTSFWNFDALFVPQEHPAREMQDTFFVEPLKGSLPDKKLVKKVREAHEVGTRDSLGWNYSWNEEKAKENILRTHTTVLSARTLAKLKKEDWPAKYFAIGRCFRNETLDWSHLFEFNQFEGIVVDENANFKHLLGYLKQFFNKIGFEKARFRPAYFPYTEMSLEIDVFHPQHNQWIELGGAGIFRPEVVEPLLGEAIPVLAWGPGYDRIMMDYYNITDIRDIYKNDLNQLRSSKQWMM